MSKDNDEYEKNWEIEDDEDDTAGDVDDDDDDDDDDEQDDDNDNDDDDDNGDDDDDDDNDEEYEEGKDKKDNEDDDDYDEEEDGDQEYYDDDGYDVEPPPQGDEDDPEYAGPDPRGQPAEYYQPEYNPEDGDDDRAGFQDEPEEQGEKRGERFSERCLMSLCVLCCCCVILALIALLLVLFVFKDEDKNSTEGSNNSPTFAPIQPAQLPTSRPPVEPSDFSYPTFPPVTDPPTILPTQTPTLSLAPTKMTVTNPTVSPTRFPTIQPTISPAPTKMVEDEIVLIPIEDTYIVDGFFAEEPHGDEETFLVQNSLDHVQEIPDAFALLRFDMSSIPFARIQNRQLSAILELTHEVSVLERGPANYTVERLNSTSLAVETLHLGIFPLPDDGIRGPTFAVAPSDDIVTVDITELIFGDLYDPQDDDQALIMIVNYGAEQDAGDRFKSREVPGSEPKLRLAMIRTPGVPDSTAAPTKPPTLAPTITTVSPTLATTNSTGEQ